MARLIAVIGDIGSGKTALMTLLLYAAQMEGSPVIANYTLRFPAIRKTFAEIATRPPGDDQLWQDAYLGTDELNIGADSYEFFQRGPKKIAFLVTQLRKDNITWIFATTRLNLIVKRIRDQVDCFMCPSDDDALLVDHKILDSNRHPIHCKGIFTCDVFDSDYQYLRSFSFDAKQIWDLYETNEHIRQ